MRLNGCISVRKEERKRCGCGCDRGFSRLQMLKDQQTDRQTGQTDDNDDETQANSDTAGKMPTN